MMGVLSDTTASLAISTLLCTVNRWCLRETITNTVTTCNFDVIFGKFNIIRISSSGVYFRRYQMQRDHVRSPSNESVVVVIITSSISASTSLCSCSKYFRIIIFKFSLRSTSTSSLHSEQSTYDTLKNKTV